MSRGSPLPRGVYFGGKFFYLFGLQVDIARKVFNPKGLRAKYLFSRGCDLNSAGDHWARLSSSIWKVYIQYIWVGITHTPRDSSGLARGFVVLGLDRILCVENLGWLIAGCYGGVEESGSRFCANARISKSRYGAPTRGGFRLK